MKPVYDPQIKKVIELFLSTYLRESGASGFVLGLSGGLDSAVAMTMAARAVSPSRVLALVMPTTENNGGDVDDAIALAQGAGVRHEVVELTKARNLIAEIAGSVENDDRGNVTARLRMAVLYSRALREKLLVLGTSNKSELLVGYFTKYGDGGCDICPLGDVYKTTVREMAYDLKLPVKIIEKAPSAGLVSGQTDEGDLGIAYVDLDDILTCAERRLSVAEAVAETGKDEGTVVRVYSMIERSKHKRRLGLVPKLGIRTVGLDWREI